MKIEGLKLFLAVTPFAHTAVAVLDREGAWTDEMWQNDFEEKPQHAGLWVWEGRAESEPDELVGGWDFVGVWRAPTAEEVSRLAAGRFPLRGHAFPATGEEEDFEEAPSRATEGR